MVHQYLISFCGEHECTSTTITNVCISRHKLQVTASWHWSLFRSHPSLSHSVSYPGILICNTHLCYNFSNTCYHFPVILPSKKIVPMRIWMSSILNSLLTGMKITHEIGYRLSSTRRINSHPSCYSCWNNSILSTPASVGLIRGSLVAPILNTKPQHTHRGRTPPYSYPLIMAQSK